MRASPLLLGLLAVAGHGLSCHAFLPTAAPLARHALSLRLSAPASSGAQTGEQIFAANCAVCHAGGQNAIVADHTLEKAAIEKYLTGGFNEKAVAYQVTNGLNAMPVFAEKLSEAEIGLVAAYVIRTAEDGWE
jgi:cytochrome c6